MEPSTPPRAHGFRNVPATPATPRFGTFEDLPDSTRKQPRAHTPHRTPRRKRAAAELATPRQTPHKRKLLVTPRQQLFPSAPALDLVTEEDSDAVHEEGETEAPTDASELELELEASEDSGTSDEDDAPAPIRAGARTALILEPIREPIKDATEARGPERIAHAVAADARAASSANWGHPHQDRPPPDVPGLWYVFRGKKLFRPLPAGAKPVEPVTLFKKEIAALDEQRREQRHDRPRVAESEEDTDVEHPA